ncbi:hypothetical protein [Erwinia persicina]|uniref:hypothetical protein n=1 Tax=Erwinia persicina TaxID=55211 RepID=UPI001784ABF7|nr:hypothetical protein [Erwinia persicina]
MSGASDNVKINEQPTGACIPGLIAVVGCDGTGKSTLTADLVKNLKTHYLTERRYLGLVSGEEGDKIKRLPLIGVWLERRLAAKSSKTQSMQTRSPALWAALIMYGFSLRRRANLRKVERLAKSGVMVISDRYPQAEIAGFHYDGPGIGVERVKGWLMTGLARREQRLYQEMAYYRPQLVIRLDIDIDTAFSRKPDHDYEELRDKISVMDKINYNHAAVLEVDSRAPYNDVLQKSLNAILAIAPQRQSP